MHPATVPVFVSHCSGGVSSVSPHVANGLNIGVRLMSISIYVTALSVCRGIIPSCCVVVNDPPPINVVELSGTMEYIISETPVPTCDQPEPTTPDVGKRTE